MRSTRAVLFAMTMVVSTTTCDAFVPQRPAIFSPPAVREPYRLDFRRSPHSARHLFRNIFSRKRNKESSNGNNQIDDHHHHNEAETSSLFPHREHPNPSQLQSHATAHAKDTVAEIKAKGGDDSTKNEAKTNDETKTVKADEPEASTVDTTPNFITAMNSKSDSADVPPLSPPSSLPTVPEPIIPVAMQDADDLNTDTSKSTEVSVSSSTRESRSANKAPNQNLSSSRRPLVGKLDEIGELFHRRAQRATAKRYHEDKRSKKILCALKTYAYYTLYLVYHVAKSSVTILPGLFRQVFQKMKLSVDDCNRVLLHNDGVGSFSSAVKTKLQRQRESEEKTYDQGSLQMSSVYVKWTTRATVSLVAAVVTASYALGGAVHVAARFFRTLSKSTSLTSSFEAAADQAMINEDRWNSVLQTVNGEKK